jgi:DNA gyrase subunit B
MRVTDYSARHLSVLEGLEAVRKRPGMYIGSTDSRGLMHCLWEIIDNSVDEALGGHCSAIQVMVNTDGSATVIDNGRGIPIDNERKTGLSGVELIFTKLHAGGKFGGGSYAASGGLHGVGASVVNALSERLDAKVKREGNVWEMSFHRGEPGVFQGSKPDSPFDPFVDASELTKGKKVPKKETGTEVTFWPDPQIFTSTEFDKDTLVARLRQTAFLVPGLRLTLHWKQDDPEDFFYEGGLIDFAEFISPDSSITPTYLIDSYSTYKETVPVLDENTGSMKSTELERECRVRASLRWGSAYETTVKSFVNIISTPKGGTHLAGFEQGLVKAVKSYIESNARKFKLGSLKLEKDDVLAGLTAVVTVSISEPQFEGQTKEVLGTPPVKSIVSNAVVSWFKQLTVSKKREDKAALLAIAEKVVNEGKARVSARQIKENQRRKNALESSSLPAKLVDCRSSEGAGSELFIVEGDSALGTAKLARDSEFQALLPIRGKILNVQKSSIADMLSNAECASITQVIGGGSGRSFDLGSVRYEKVILMSDADVDGAHIRTLLLTLFFRYMRPLVEAGRVYAAVPPLHRVVIVHPGSKPNDTVYTYSQQQLDRLLAQLESKGLRYQQPIQRYKGLGEMDADQLAETTMNPEMRSLRRITAKDAEMSDQVFELLMGSEVAPRRDFIISSADSFERQNIDA